MVKYYISSSGKVVVIAQMPDAYLVNSLLYYKKRLNLLKEKGATGVYLVQIKEIVESLAEEVSKRKLTLDN